MRLVICAGARVGALFGQVLVSRCVAAAAPVGRRGDAERVFWRGRRVDEEATGSDILGDVAAAHGDLWVMLWWLGILGCQVYEWFMATRALVCALRTGATEIA